MSVPPPPGQYGPPPQQPPGGPNPWGAQQPWQPGPPKKGGPGKWIFGAIALLAVIAVTVAITVFVTRDGGGGSNGDPATPSASDIASANDTGPVTIITEEPTCEKWRPINTMLSSRTKNGWERRDPSIPAANWSPEQKSQFESVGQAMRSSADQAVPLVRQTPHRVIRELYEQFIAYARSYADRIAVYTPPDESLARVAVNGASTLSSICASISYGSAGSAATNSDSLAPPQQVEIVGDPDNPQKFLGKNDPQVCNEISEITANFDSQTAEWRSQDTATPSSQWSPERKALQESVSPVFDSFASRFVDLSKRSELPTVQDFTLLIAQYLKAYSNALPSYTTADGYLMNVGTNAGAMINHGCRSAEA